MLENAIRFDPSAHLHSVMEREEAGKKVSANPEIGTEMHFWGFHNPLSSKLISSTEYILR